MGGLLPIFEITAADTAYVKFCGTGNPISNTFYVRAIR